MNRHYYEKIAELMLFAVDFREGDKLVIQLNPDCREAVKSLAFKAYQRGASYVTLRYIDDFIHAAAISAGKRSVEFPDHFRQTLKEISQPDWKTISYLSFSEGDVYEDLPGDISTDYFKCYQDVISYRRKQTLSDGFAWTLTFIPTEGTAVKVFPGLPAEEALERYWKEVIKIMRLDREDPVGFWRDKMAKDKQRSGYLTGLAPKYLEFTGPGTDFRIGIPETVQWLGGFKDSAAGNRVVANLPTDEIFTSPDWRTAEGRVSLTRPFVMHQNLGAVPEKAWFEFKNGRVEDFGAESGRDSLETLFARDERARYLGEVALVDPYSPFAESGLIFYNGLYDENAACHLALGSSYSATLIEEGRYTDEQLLEMGLNQSSVHEDMMVGGPEVDVTAVGRDGKRYDVIKDGKFLI